MKISELKEQIEWMPDDYEIVVKIYDGDFDSEIKKDISFEPLHNERQILIYAS